MSGTSEAADSEEENARVAFFTPIAAPILHIIDPIQVKRLFKERERYEV